VLVGGFSVDDVETKEASDDLEEGELLDDGETDERAEESEIVDPPAPAAIPSLLDMKISPPPNGKTFFCKVLHRCCVNSVILVHFKHSLLTITI